MITHMSRRLRNTVAPSMKSLATRGMASIQETLTELVPVKQAELVALKKEHGHKVIGDVTVDQCIGGGRDIKSLFWETSLLDAQEGIRFRGYSIPELQQKLPTFKGPAGQGEPTPEALVWLMLTDTIPTKAEADSLTHELYKRSEIPQHVVALLKSLPKSLHPMSQLVVGLMALQKDSKFAAAYASGVHKKEYWKHTLEDILDVWAKLPELAALVFSNTYKDGSVGSKDPSLDYSANFARRLGYNKPEFDELMRLYLVIHSDHEGGNASAHTTHLVGSTLSDPYLSYSAGLNALAGPLHGLANQEVLGWILDLQKKFKAEGKPVNKETITQFAWETLKSGKVIPGYGHAVLRKTDPRYTSQREFALKYLPDDELFKIVGTIYEVVPDVLTEHGKTKNPYPNVDSHSGVLLWHYGFKEFNYYTVLFGVSRALGALSQVFWDRALGMPLERPKSVTSKWILEHVNNSKSQ
ncbi:citrate synthase [Nannochloropsis gaditana]|uniref:Citrate synthase n=1 Tax=Nannochloropsis gaditana TaxID=72520 RepID=W7U4C6_9STRA|nr:citrate synthase [Nannochloropsis gaditana]